MSENSPRRIEERLHTIQQLANDLKWADGRLYERLEQLVSECIDWREDIDRRRRHPVFACTSEDIDG